MIKLIPYSEIGKNIIYQPFNGVLHAFVRVSANTRIGAPAKVVGTKCGHKFTATGNVDFPNVKYDLPVCEDCKHMEILEELAE